MRSFDKTDFIKVKDLLKENKDIRWLRCNSCGEMMTRVKGKHGSFLGCKNWKECDECKKTFSLYGSKKEVDLFCRYDQINDFH